MGETQKVISYYYEIYQANLCTGALWISPGAIRIPEFEPAFSPATEAVKNLETRLRTSDADYWEALEIAVKLDTMRICPEGALAVCITAVMSYCFKNKFWCVV